MNFERIKINLLMIIYLDIVFFENIFMNYIILLSTSIFSKINSKKWNLLLSSIVGALYSVMTYLLKLSNFQNILLKILISILMIQIGFRHKKILNIFKTVIIFYLVSFTFGGAAFMILYFLNPENIISNNGVLIGTYPLKVTLIGASIAFGIISVTSKIVKDRISKKAMLCDLEIFYNGNVSKIKTMLDTGNLLQDPITQEDVIIVEKDCLNNLISDDILNNLDNIISGKWLNSSSVYDYKFKIIPFTSLGNNNGILIGFKPDYIRVLNEEVLFRKDVVVGIYNGKLSKTNLYSSLIGINILKEERNNGKYASKT